MSTGKQLSFQFGEVSPTLRYRANDVSYQQGLSKLKNMYVRREGGVSNRPGFEYVSTAPTQNNLPFPGGPAGIKGHIFWNAKANAWWTLEYANLGTDALPDYGFYINRVDTLKLVTSPVTRTIGPTPEKVRFTHARDYIFVTPEWVQSGAGGVRNVALYADQATVTTAMFEGNFGKGAAHQVYSMLGISSLSKGQAPYLSASYLVTTVDNRGVEREFLNFATDPSHTNPSTAVSPALPHASLTTELIIPLNTNGEAAVRFATVKFFNIYRATGSVLAGAPAYYRLVGRVPYSTTGPFPNAIYFTDYGGEAPANTAPLDASMFIQSAPAIAGAIAATYYQQRLILSLKPYTTDTIKPGDLIASKVGAPAQLRQPIIYNDTGAFQFSIPVTDATPVVAMLSMERMIAGTVKGTYVVKGGEQGSLTPTQVNPYLISTEGCSETIEPKMIGRRGYFINNTHTKLMAIEFGDDGNLAVYDASVYASHFFRESPAAEIEMIGGEENTVYVLRKDGKLVRGTAGENGIHGFSLIETDGYIESIFRGKSTRRFPPDIIDTSASEKLFDTLYCYVIRNGVRSVEAIIYREDEHREGEMYADCATMWGTRLTYAGEVGFYKKRYPLGHWNTDLAKYLNITSASGDWTPGDPLKLWVYSIDEETIPSSPIQFYYEDADGKVQVFKLTYDIATQSDLINMNTVVPGAVGFETSFTAISGQTVPEELRNVWGNTGLAIVDRNKRASRYVPLTNQLVNNPAVGGPLQGLVLSNTVTTTSGPVDIVVSCEGDVISSPLNPNKETLQVRYEAGQYKVDLPDYYAYGYVGLPYVSEFETLDLETADNRTLTDSNKLINAAGVALYETRGGFFGMPGAPLEQMEEPYQREDEDFSQQDPNTNDFFKVTFPANWNRKGRVNIKQVDPLPMTILAVYPQGIAGD